MGDESGEQNRSGRTQNTSEVPASRLDSVKKTLGRVRMWGRRDIPFVKTRQINTFGIAGVGALATAATLASGIGGGEHSQVSAQGVDTSNNTNTPRHEEKYNPEQKTSSDQMKELLKIVPEDMRKDAAIAIPLIEKALKGKGIYSENVFAYALAAVEHESMFSAREEIDGRNQAIKHNYNGENDFGRGYLQFTGPEVLGELSKFMGIDLVNNPSKLLEPEISARALACYFEYKGTAKLADQGKFLDAYVTINPGAFESQEEHIWRAPYNIEQDAKHYLEILKRKDSNRLVVTNNPLQDVIDGTTRDFSEKRSK